MKLKANWRAVFRKAWSIRLGVIAGVFSGLEVVLPMFVDAMPRSVFATLAMLTAVGAVVARLMAQPKADL